MTSLELVVFGVLWIIFATLTVLVLVLYRQVERVYDEAASPQPAPLAPGVEAPDIEVLDAAGRDGMAPLPFPLSDHVALLAFVSTSCKVCGNVLRLLTKPSPVEAPVTVLVSGEGYYDFREHQDDRFAIFWLAHPPDASHLYGVTLVPFIYALRGQTILASRVVRSEADVGALLDDALMVENQLAFAQS